MTYKIFDIDALRNICDQCKNLSHSALSKAKPVVIFGTGSFGKDLFQILTSSEFKVSAFVESNPSAQFIHGIPVYKLNNTPEVLLGAQVVIGIFNRSTPYKHIHNLLVTHGFKDFFFPWHLYEQFSAELAWRYWLSKPIIFSDNQISIEDAFSNLADEESKETFLRIIKFRAGQDLEFSEFQSHQQQYFNDITLRSLPKNGLTFVDCGAYNGDTLSELCSKHRIKFAYLFEPDPKNFKNLVSKVSALGISATCLPLAVSDKYEVLSFSGDIGESGSLSMNGGLSVAAAALDDLLKFQKIDFLKFDVEGGEFKAIQGSEGLIRQYNPVLAISLYHKPSDLWDIPLLIKKISMNYKLYIRQHWNNSFDSVLYAIPI